jgi:hypothetical protein
MSEVAMSPAVRDMLLQFFSPGFNLYRTLFWLVFYMVLFGLFSMIGGILMVSILNRKKTD